MGHQQHQIHLKNLREGEHVLHNCSSHVLIHIKVHLFYFIGILAPLLCLIFLNRAGAFEESITMVWFLYTCYLLILSTYFFIRGVNFELGGCVITNQRLIRFGYSGLVRTVEREILPNKIEDFKIEKKGLLSLFFNTAYIYIRTSNNQTDVLRWVIQPEKVRDAYATMVKSFLGQTQARNKTPSDPNGAAWIDEALKNSENNELNIETHRKGMITDIGDVFKGKKKE